MNLRTTSLAVLAAFTLVGPASAAVLFTDDFSAFNSGNFSDVNYDLAARQGGSQATQSYTTAGNVQVGNPDVFGGTGEYMMLADFAGSAQLSSLTLNSTLVASNEKLVISFTTDVVHATEQTDWMSFTMSPIPGQPYFPVVGSGNFGFLLRANGGMQAFNNGGAASISGPTFATSSGVVNLSFTFSGSDGTGSPFAGLGTQVAISDGTNTWTTVLDTGFTSQTIGFGTLSSSTRGMVDNISITTLVPEPTTWALLTIGLTVVMVRRRRQS